LLFSIKSDYPSDVDWIRETLPVGPLQCNCSIFWHVYTQEAVIIDPGGDAPKLCSFLQEKALKPKLMLHTHAHIDHVGASAEIARQYPDIQAYLHSDDAPLYRFLELQAAFLGLQTPERIDMAPLQHDMHIALDTQDFVQVLHTPGHSPGSASFYFKPLETLFTGDTLFFQNVGRVDLWGGDAQALKRSVDMLLYDFEEHHLCIPGHGRCTSIAHERTHNPLARLG
jgi:glyoxylase-like metal-dependent hydrolase (beta-lactamase superfamily II)